MKKSIILVRHGRQVSKDCNVNVPLSEEGRRQAELLGRRLEGLPFDAMYASDLIRAVETAEILDSHLHLGLQIRKGIEEIDWGDLTGLPPEKLKSDYREYMRERKLCLSDSPLPGGECGMDVFRRAEPVFQEIISSDAQNILMVTHGGTIRAIVCGLLGIPMRFKLAFGTVLENTSLTEILYNTENGRYSLERFNDYQHLLAEPELLRRSW